MDQFYITKGHGIHILNSRHMDDFGNMYVPFEGFVDDFGVLRGRFVWPKDMLEKRGYFIMADTPYWSVDCAAKVAVC